MPAIEKTSEEEAAPPNKKEAAPIFEVGDLQRTQSGAADTQIFKKIAEFFRSKRVEAQGDPELQATLTDIAGELADYEAELTRRRKKSPTWRRWAARAVLGATLAFGGAKILAPESEPAKIERVEKLETPVKDVLIGHLPQAELPGAKIKINDLETEREYFAEDLDAAVNLAMKKNNPGIANTCDGAEQCFYYYGDKSGFNENFTGLLAKAKWGEAENEQEAVEREELIKFIGEVIREGFVPPSGISFGGVVGRVGAGYNEFPDIFFPEDKKEFYQENFTEMVSFIEAAAREYNLLSLSGEQREKARKHLAGIVKQELLTRIRFKAVWLGYQNYVKPMVREALEQGIKDPQSGKRRPSTVQVWRNDVKTQQTNVENFIKFLGKNSPIFKDAPAEEIERRAERARLIIERDGRARFHTALADTAKSRRVGREHMLIVRAAKESAEIEKLDAVIKEPGEEIK